MAEKKKRRWIKPADGKAVSNDKLELPAVGSASGKDSPDKPRRSVKQVRSALYGEK